MTERIRKATIADIHEIHEILNYFAGQGLLLPRSLSELYDHVRDFFVVESGESAPLIHGVCGLGVCWEDLAEIKSLAVSEEHQHRGLGKKLVEACMEDAHNLGIRRVFTLTYIPRFFLKLGFEEIEKSMLPHKIWADCLKCSKFPNCDETAMIIDL